MVSDVAFAADDGLDVLVIPGRSQKFGHSGHRSVVGDGQAWHFQLVCPLKQFRDLCDSVKQRIIRVYMKMCK